MVAAGRGRAMRMGVHARQILLAERLRRTGRAPARDMQPDIQRHAQRTRRIQNTGSTTGRSGLTSPPRPSLTSEIFTTEVGELIGPSLSLFPR